MAGLGQATGAWLLQALAVRANLPHDPAVFATEPPQLVFAVLLEILNQDFRLGLELPSEWEAPLLAQLQQADSDLDLTFLRGVVAVAVSHELRLLGFTATRLGLQRGDAQHDAFFLFSRAQILSPGSERFESCLGAARALARRQGDSELLADLGEYCEEELLFGPPELSLTEREVDQVLAQERRSTEFALECQCPQCQAQRMGEPDLDLEEILNFLGGIEGRGSRSQPRSQARKAGAGRG
jgi:hypothetical protein